MREEPLIPFPAPRSQIANATHFRSTVIVASLAALREAGFYDRYLAILASAHKERLLESVAGAWLPMATARAHYDACEGLALSADQQTGLGRAVGKSALGTLFSTAVRAARGAGVTPWTVFPQLHRLWLRGLDGGAAAVFRLGPKEARAEFVGCELLDIAYFRVGLRGILLGSSTLFCQRAYIHELPQRRPFDVAFRLQWA